MVTIENDFIRAEVSEHGAELQSLWNKTAEIEHLWQGDPKIWGRKAPVLFPIVGKLKDDQYTYQGQTYHMTQHGFARDQDFEIVAKSDTEIIFELRDNAETRKMYPFAFKLTIRYALINNLLKVRYRVENPSDDALLYYSVGGHPGFKVPFIADTKFTDYFLNFSPRKSRIRVPLGASGLIDFSARTLAATDADIALSHDLFKDDALIYELLGKGDTFRIKTEQSEHYLELMVNEGPYVGVWSAYPTQGDFVCIEPWWGIADGVNSDGDLTHKVGIRKLTPHEHYTARYRIALF
ncbi:aldose 1-epimerase family protein [Agrilactobacillus fermenti]|uniref:aldose 1-epimerase family protein n=1 Tax=Agrilactobacillus fermenti TaxID=2586909 RepID=UPI001E624CC5|nr:aldose 1-epimerase family protein [Agrilactobacillus fermenti]MCD2256561.1 aldose 1-epimerase family protein [Agrilactobacillus fermenti]